MGFIFKVARTEQEFAQIHSLNYRTFVEEIPQHPKEKNRLRIDPFHHENTYLICLKEDQLIGMIAVRSNRPFSLDKKIGQVETHLPIEAESLCEIRLLAVEKPYRTGRVFFGLFQCLARYCLDQGYDAAVISGTTLQTKLYLQIGFRPFYEKIGTEQAQFVPMYMTKAMFEKFLLERIPLTSYNYLPGPVVPAKEVTDAFVKPPISHRSKQFHQLLASVKEKLLKLTGSRHCQIFFGSGTLANDVIALQLRKHGKGLILVNGEFGSRLAKQAKRANVEFIPYEVPWGEPFSKEEIRSMLVKHQCKWIWFVHCETSTGMLNSLEDIIEIAEELDVKVCLDAISSIGAIPLNLQHVYLASGVSGKAIGSYSGLSFVFHQEEMAIDPAIPAYLDLGYYSKNQSIPFTHSSNLMAALNGALSSIMDWNLNHFQTIREEFLFIYRYLKENNINILVEEEHACPVILTIPLPSHISAKEIGDDMKLAGFTLHYESEYLQKMNWLQISPIGRIDRKNTEQMLKTFVSLSQYYQKFQTTNVAL